MSLRISRRNLLRAASGAALTLPLLPSLRAGAAADQFPKRLVTMYTPNGVIHEAWWPTNVTSETDFALNRIHEPLAAYKSRLLILGGLEMKVTKMGPGGPHQRGIGALFTNSPLAEGVFVDGCGSRAGWATGISVDQAVANVIGQDSMIKSLELGVRASENDVQGRISYAAAERPLPPITSPLELYQRMFKDFVPQTSAGDEAAAALLSDRRSVLDAVSKELGALSPRLTAEDRHTLDQHLTLVRDVERRLSLGLGSCTVPGAPAMMDAASEVDMPAIAELELDLLALAFACDLTRVSSFEISTALNRIRYPWADSLGEGHALSHSGSSDENAAAQLIRRAAWHSSLIAHFFDRLAAVREGEGSVLDNTLLLWGNEVSMGTTHTHDNMPLLVAGGSWAFKTGRYVRHEDGNHADLLVSVLNAMGSPVQTFGQAEFCRGPLTNMS